MAGYVTIIDEFNDKGLTAVQKIALAVINGFSQNEQGVFNGSIAYLSRWIGASKSTTLRTLKYLEDNGYIVKSEGDFDGLNKITYKVTDLLSLQAENDGIKMTPNGVKMQPEGIKMTPSQNDTGIKMTPPRCQNDTTPVSKCNRPGVKMTPNNTSNNISNNTRYNTRSIAARARACAREEKKLEDLQQAFASTLQPFRDKYTDSMLQAFYDYWAAPLQNPKPSQVKAGILLKYQTQETWSLAGRLRTWAKRDTDYAQKTQPPEGPRVNARGETRMVESYRKANEAFNKLLHPEDEETEEQ